MFLKRLALESTVWFWDYDGSLCPHLETWEPVNYDPREILKLMQALEARCQGLFWNTGRRVVSLGNVNRDFLKFPGYFVQGTVRWDGATETTLSPLLPETIRQKTLETVGALFQDFRCEVKATSLRVAKAKGAFSKHSVEHVVARLRSLTPVDWNWVTGNRGAELLPAGFDKAFALRHELHAKPASLKPIVVGDDVLDAPAVREALLRGGFAILVGDGCGWVTEIPHRTDQVIFCRDPQHVHQLLWEALGS